MKKLWAISLNLLLVIPFNGMQAALPDNFDAQDWLAPLDSDVCYQYELYQNYFSKKEPNYCTDTYNARDWVKDLKKYLAEDGKLSVISYNNKNIYLLDYLKEVKAEYLQKISLSSYLSNPQKFLQTAQKKSQEIDILMQHESKSKFGDIDLPPLAPSIRPPGSKETVSHPLSLQIYHRVYQLNLCATTASIVLPSLAIINYKHLSSQQKNIMIALQGSALLYQYLSYRWGKFDDSQCSFVKYQKGSQHQSLSHTAKFLAYLAQYFVIRDPNSANLSKASQLIGLLAPEKCPLTLFTLPYQAFHKDRYEFDKKLQYATLALRSISLCIDLGNKIHTKNRAFQACRKPYEQKIKRYEEGIKLVQYNLEKRCAVMQMCKESALTDIVGVQPYSQDVGNILVDFLFEKDQQPYYEKVIKDSAKQQVKNQRIRKVSAIMALVGMVYMIKRRFS